MAPRSFLVLLLLTLALSGCASDAPADEGDDAPPTLEGPIEVYSATVPFSAQTSGSQALAMPAGARTFTLTVTWTSDAPVTATGEVFVQVVDASGEPSATCSYAVGVSQPADQGCEQSGSATSPPYELTWRGTGTVRADIVVTAA